MFPPFLRLLSRPRPLFRAEPRSQISPAEVVLVPSTRTHPLLSDRRPSLARSLDRRRPPITRAFDLAAAHSREIYAHVLHLCECSPGYSPAGATSTPRSNRLAPPSRRRPTSSRLQDAIRETADVAALLAPGGAPRTRRRASSRRIPAGSTPDVSTAHSNCEETILRPYQIRWRGGTIRQACRPPRNAT